MSFPVVGGLAVTLSVISGRAPDIPVSEGVVLRLSRLLEPFVLIAGVVDNQIENQLHASLMQPVPEDVHIRNVAILRINGFVVANIVALF